MKEENGVFVEKNVQDELLMKVDTDIQLTSVILSDINKGKVNDFLAEIKYKDTFKQFGLTHMNRLLFYGASGCGKTFLAKALSNHLKYKLLYVDIARALSQGNVADNIWNVFKLANTGTKETGYYMVFLDECDSIAWNRDAKDAESGVIRRATNSLFQLIDQMDSNVILICATNMLHRLDPAFERRFNMKLEFVRPEISIQETIQGFLHPSFKIIDDMNDTVTERRCRGKLSYYELQGIAERMMKKAIMRSTTTIKMSDVYADAARALNVKISFKTDTDEN